MLAPRGTRWGTSYSQRPLYAAKSETWTRPVIPTLAPGTARPPCARACSTSPASAARTSRSRCGTTSSSASCIGSVALHCANSSCSRGPCCRGCGPTKPYRAIVDLDLLSQGENDPDSVARGIAAVCAIDVPGDSVIFDSAAISAEPIRAEEEYSASTTTCGGRSIHRAHPCEKCPIMRLEMAPFAAVFYSVGNRPGRSVR